MRVRLFNAQSNPAKIFGRTVLGEVEEVEQIESITPCITVGTLMIFSRFLILNLTL